MPVKLDNLNIVILDCEVMKNALIIVLYHHNTGERHVFIKTKFFDNLKELKKFICNDTIVCGFNNIKYDNWIIKWIVYHEFNVENIDLYHFSTKLITNRIEDNFKTKMFSFYSGTKGIKYWEDDIDLLNILGKRRALKEYGVSLGVKKLQEFPFDPDSELNKEEILKLEKYCHIDVDITVALFKELKKDIELRLFLNETYQGEKKQASCTKSFLPMSEPQIAQSFMAVKYCAKEKLNYNDLEYKKTTPVYKNIPLSSTIHSCISFKTTQLQDFLKDVKEYFIDFQEVEKETFTGSFKTIGIKNRNEIKIDFEFNNLKLKFGLGGLHSVTKNVTYESTSKYQIIDIDVASFYPSLIINMELRPDFLKPSWNKIYKELRQMRLDAKKKGDKTTADALKIVLNSLYGKFNSQYFYGYDPKTAYTVTVNGQLILLMLIERLSIQGFNVISANTDGLVVIAENDKMDLFGDTYKEFAKEVNLEFDEIAYKKISFESVNDYVAEIIEIDEKTGETKEYFKRKGSFDCLSLKKSLNMAIVYEAVENYIFKEICPEKTILNCKDISKFAISKKTDKKFLVFYDNKKIQNINRYLIAKSEFGKPLYYLNKAGNKSKIDYGDNAYLINDLPDNFDFNIIDYNFYIKKAKEIITKLTTNITVDTYKDKLLSDVEELSANGLPLVPKLFKSNIKGFKNTEIKSDWTYKEYPTIATHTGYNAGIIAIDVDYFEKLPEKLLNLLLSSGGLTVWQDNRGSNSGFNPKTHKRFKKIYKYNRKNLKSFNRLEDYGFELHFSRVVNVAGAYDYEREYLFCGELNDLPVELENYLLLAKPKNFRKSNIEISSQNPTITPEKFNTFIENYLSEIGQEFCTQLPTSDYIQALCDEDSQVVYLTDCFCKDLHSSYGTSPMTILLNKSCKIRLLCFHASCKISLKEIEKELNSKFKKSLNQGINFENIIDLKLTKKEASRFFYENYTI